MTRGCWPLRLLHDTIEDTTTDCDDIIEKFGPEVAKWVAAVTKETRLPHDEREAAYAKGLAAADWQAKVVKLADLYDNIGDSAHLSRGRNGRAARSRGFYLEAVRNGFQPRPEPALKLVERAAGGTGVSV